MIIKQLKHDVPVKPSGKSKRYVIDQDDTIRIITKEEKQTEFQEEMTKIWPHLQLGFYL